MIKDKRDSVLESSSSQFPNLNWIGHRPVGSNQIAILIPQYNEASNCDFKSRLWYYKGVSELFHQELDVILIDDGSTDESLEDISSFCLQNPGCFFVASVKPNSNKVGALCLVAKAISHQFIVLTDFDTDILGLESIRQTLHGLDRDKSVMGGYFRMLPFEGNGVIFDFQQIEYSILRSLYKYTKKQGTVAVMPGAGCIYKREHLLNIYNEHSGFRNGEDREATMIGLRLGYTTDYLDNILSLTRPPLTLRALIKQRIRWNLGYLETWYKERDYYANQIGQVNFIGLIFIFDMIAAIFMAMILPVGMLLFLIKGWIGLGSFFLGTYLFFFSLSIVGIVMEPDEFTEIKGKIAKTTLLYPVVKIIVGYFSWFDAIRIFIRKVNNL